MRARVGAIRGAQRFSTMRRKTLADCEWDGQKQGQCRSAAGYAVVVLVSLHVRNGWLRTVRPQIGQGSFMRRCHFIAITTDQRANKTKPGQKGGSPSNNRLNEIAENTAAKAHPRYRNNISRRVFRYRRSFSSTVVSGELPDKINTSDVIFADQKHKAQNYVLE